MKRLKIVWNLLIWVCILAFFVISYHSLSGILRFKEMSNVWEVFRHEKRDSYDVIFFGSSHQFCSIDVNLLYEEYGINGFMLATPGQSIPMSYYAAKEAIRLQHPKTIVLEGLYFVESAEKLSRGHLHSFFDGMPLGFNKIQAVYDLIPKEDRVYYLFDIGYYNVRWKNLTKFDFVCTVNRKRGAYERQEVVYPIEAIPVIDREDTLPVDDEVVQYMEKLIDLCKQNDIELVVYVAPHDKVNTEDTMQDQYDALRRYNWMGEFLAQKGVPFYNTFYEMQEMGLISTVHYMDSHHLNAFGQETFTRFMAEMGRIPQ